MRLKIFLLFIIRIPGFLTFIYDSYIAGPSDYSPRSSSEWPNRQRYEDWQRDQGEPDIEELNVKDLIAGWAMGEGRPWFD
jgi:hypothetical protein